MHKQLPCCIWVQPRSTCPYSTVIPVSEWKMARELCVRCLLPCRIGVTSAAQEGGARAFPAAWRGQTYVAAKSRGQKSLFTGGTKHHFLLRILTATTHLPRHMISLWLWSVWAKWHLLFPLDFLESFQIYQSASHTHIHTSHLNNLLPSTETVL